MQKPRLEIPYIGKSNTMKIIDFPVSEQICEGNLAAQKYYSAERQSRHKFAGDMATANPTLISSLLLGGDLYPNKIVHKCARQIESRKVYGSGQNIARHHLKEGKVWNSSTTVHSR